MGSRAAVLAGAGALGVLAACGAEDECQGHVEWIEYTTQVDDGESAERLMARLGGTFIGKVEWLASSNPYLDVHPMAGEAGLSLTLAYEGGQVGLQRSMSSGTVCTSRLGFEARLTLASDDGAVQGSWVVGVTHELGAGLRLALDPLEFLVDNEGDFSAGLKPGPYEPGTEVVAWTGDLTDTAASGYITVSAASIDPATVSGLNETVGAWQVSRP